MGDVAKKGDRFVEMRISQNIQDRRKGFIAHNIGLRRHFHDRRRHINPSLRGQTIAAEYAPSIRERVGERCMHGVIGLRIDQRSDQIQFVQRIADRQSAIYLLQLRHQIIVDAVMDDQTTHRCAALPRRTCSAERDGAYGKVYIR